MQVNCCGDLADTAARLGTMAIIATHTPQVYPVFRLIPGPHNNIGQLHLLVNSVNTDYLADLDVVEVADFHSTCTHLPHQAHSTTTTTTMNSTSTVVSTAGPSAPMPIALPPQRGRTSALPTHPCPHVADLFYSVYNAVRGVPTRSDRSPSPGLATSPPSSSGSSLSSSPTSQSEVFKALTNSRQ
ncbi:uncharacterized protein EHS24_008552 [Apiotrichum porosum]|uniref:Uncharacterized protein n=1 Tax=Apiotrichum porosum TaxID=105984 RepID=A0A427XQP6_9TREE|nr:uncharacterized protein EHS24_008552 [Apiotrichum porosum]RSH81118.1 hypothetical protein EHS24_008552 [Apiotrichum porosum]